MPSSHPSDLPKAGIFGAGIGMRIGLAAAVVIVLWIATAWAVTSHAPPTADDPAAPMHRE